MKSRGGRIKFYVCVWIIVWRPGGKGLTNLATTEKKFEIYT